MIEHVLRIEARPETVWGFLTDPVRLARWWGEAQAVPEPGGVLRVRMSGGPRPVMRGEFVELTPYERVVFTFGWEKAPGVPDLPPGSSRVEITLKADDGATVLVLRHTGLPPGLAGETRDGWAGLLEGLGRAAGGPEGPGERGAVGGDG
ncbi:SRPBCC domain-containing protein [Spongiactinospora sp. TRM90649]|uniref:SRPBCC family protein n=1 Tax=Spongiactinospora sp. TRM90649 TaxID=3031114 RepID=UPI0023F82693|nr:SRPBCC domain-containing protein [Spongiactinospora sp. TRM90649]MDF5757294.1 SRPBCC domain-containing protein [Spongiactinospora sp. TRM90649]